MGNVSIGRPHGLKGSHARSRDSQNRAGKRVLFSLARRRTELVSDLGRLNSPGRRYENLCLATAIARTELRWLAALSETSRDAAVDRCLLRGIELELLRLESSLEKTRRWLVPSARERARARAAKRFQSITTEIRRDLQSRAQAPPATARFAPVSEEAQEADPGRCTALTWRGAQCRNRASADALCQLHARMASPARPWPVGAALVPTVVAEVEPGQARIRDRVRRPLPDWAGAARRAGVKLGGIALPRPAISLRSLRRALRRPALARPAPARPARPHLNLFVGWAAAPAALAAAFALVWTGLSSGDDAQLGPPLVASGAPATQAEVTALTDASQGDRNAAGPSGGATTGDRAKRAKDDGSSADREHDQSTAGPDSDSAPAAPAVPNGSTLVANPAPAPGASPGTGSPAPAPSAPAPEPEPSPEPSPSPSPGASNPPANPSPSQDTLVGTVESLAGEVRGLLP
jgi:hypothetical protein